MNSMDNDGPDYCYRCKKVVPCECGNPIITHDGWIKVLEDILDQITTLCGSYAEFVEPTKGQWIAAHHLLNNAGGCSLSAITGSRRQHVIDGIEKIIDKKRSAFEGLPNG